MSKGLPYLTIKITYYFYDMEQIKGLTYQEIMELYKNGGPLVRSWLHDHAHNIMDKEKPE